MNLKKSLNYFIWKDLHEDSQCCTPGHGCASSFQESEQIGQTDEPTGAVHFRQKGEKKP